MGFDFNSLEALTKIATSLRNMNPQELRTTLAKASQALLEGAAALSRMSKVLDDANALIAKIFPYESK